MQKFFVLRNNFFFNFYSKGSETKMFENPWLREMGGSDYHGVPGSVAAWRYQSVLCSVKPFGKTMKSGLVAKL